VNGIDMRRVTEDEWPAVLDNARVTFGEEYTDEDVTSFRLAFPFERSLGAFERGRLVGVTAVLPFALTVPGGASVSMGGLSWVGVLPTHRRRGILRALVRDQFDDMLKRGEIVSGLGASEGTIYGRYGYGPATSAISFQVERPYSQFLSQADQAGRMSLLGLGEAAAELPELYERLRLLQPGSTDRPGWWWQAYLVDPPHDREGASRLYHVKYDNAAGIADGYAAYRLREKWVGEIASLEVKVVELLAADRPAYEALWRYLLDTDLSRTISCYRAHVDEPLRWLLADPRNFNVTALYDNLWLRLLDAPRALAARAYRDPGRLVLEIADPFPCPRTLNLELHVDRVGEPGAGCRETTASPDLALGMDALAMAYLGGASFANLAAAGRIRELRPGAVALADAMFCSTIAPFCCTDF
jgi:predicted acetyltransferase